jgi:hypothetical protein
MRNVSGTSIQFDYRGGSAADSTTVPDGSTVTVSINDLDRKPHRQLALPSPIAGAFQSMVKVPGGNNRPN